MLDRSQMDLARVVQAIVVLIGAVFPATNAVAGSMEVVIIAAMLAIYGLIEAKKRASVTPLADPRDSRGEPLRPTPGH